MPQQTQDTRHVNEKMLCSSSKYGYMRALSTLFLFFASWYVASYRSSSSKMKAALKTDETACWLGWGKRCGTTVQG